MATERWKHGPCGKLMTPGEMDKHECPRMPRDFTARMRNTGAGTGYTRVDEKPSSELKSGARVTFEHQGETHHGTIWSEAPHMDPSGGNRPVPMRHVVPDGWRDTIPLPKNQLTEVVSHMDASRSGEFHTAALPMSGEAEYGEQHNRRRAKAAGGSSLAQAHHDQIRRVGLA